jgi:hypothetical protein
MSGSWDVFMEEDYIRDFDEFMDSKNCYMVQYK